jgi:transcriptional antiterminator RfaH
MSTCSQVPLPVTSANVLQPAASLHWYVVYTRPRHEKIVAQQCQQRSIETFLPIYVAQRIWSTRRAELQLFPTYLFVRMSVVERLKVLTIPSAISLVSFQGVPATVPNTQVEALINAIKHRSAQPHEYLAVGKLVRISSGPFRGLSGVIVRRQGNVKFIVSFHWMCRSVAVLLDAGDLEQVESLI